jgi:hypothetical protein
MAKGKPVASVHSVFSNRVKELQQQAMQLAQSAGGLRFWQIPAVLQQRDLLHVPSLHDPAWNRNAINENYEQAVQQYPGGTCGDVASLKVQMDYNAAEERAFRARHASVVRCICHAHGRRAGHGSSDGVFQAAERMAADLVKAGAM